MWRKPLVAHVFQISSKLDGGVEMMKAGDHCFICRREGAREGSCVLDGAETNLACFCRKSQVASPIIEGPSNPIQTFFWPAVLAWQAKAQGKSTPTTPMCDGWWSFCLLPPCRAGRNASICNSALHTIIDAPWPWVIEQSSSPCSKVETLSVLL